MAAQVDFNISAYSTLRDVTCSPADNIIVGIGLLFFFLGLFIFRYKAIISPSIERLKIEISTLDAKISAYPEAFKKSDTAVEQMRIVTTIEEKTQNLLWYDKWFISGGEVIAGWRLLHVAKISNMERYEIDRIIDELYVFHSRLVDLERSDAKVIAKKIENTLAQFEKTEISATVKEIKETLTKLEKTDNKSIIEAIRKRLSEEEEQKPSITTLKALLKEGMEIYYDQQDNYYEFLADWQNKTTWLTYIALLLIGVLVWADNNALLLVAGGIGGLLSKLRSVIQKPGTPNDYGFSWSTLFLAPLVGALTGWAGVYLVLVMIKMNVLGEMFTNLLSGTTTDSQSVLIIVAAVFGYSAGLFEKMISGIESYATEEKNKMKRSRTEEKKEKKEKVKTSD